MALRDRPGIDLARIAGIGLLLVLGPSFTASPALAQSDCDAVAFPDCIGVCIAKLYILDRLKTPPCGLCFLSGEEWACDLCDLDDETGDPESCYECDETHAIDACTSCSGSFLHPSCSACTESPIGDFPECLECAGEILFIDTIRTCAGACRDHKCDVLEDFLTCMPNADLGWACSNNASYDLVCDSVGSSVLSQLRVACGPDEGCDYDTGLCNPCREDRICLPHSDCEADLSRTDVCYDPRDGQECHSLNQRCMCYQEISHPLEECFDDVDQDGTLESHEPYCSDPTTRIVHFCDPDVTDCVPQIDTCSDFCLDGSCCTDADADGFAACCGDPTDPCCQAPCDCEDVTAACGADCFPGNPETCDGFDNDCDGFTDHSIVEGFDLGPCTGRSPGEAFCQSGRLFCEYPGDACRLTSSGPELIAPEPELCDGLDNDCDGARDEAFPIWQRCDCFTAGDLCGRTACNPAAMPGCVGEECVTCDCPPPGEVGEQTETICNGKDDNCDGFVDNVAGGTTVCQCAPQPDGSPGRPSLELCDGIDNDCDGMIDEGLILDCSDGQGRCVSSCIAGAWEPCGPTGSGVEICDELDNDCDGAADGDAVHSPGSPVLTFADGTSTKDLVFTGMGTALVDVKLEQSETVLYARLDLTGFATKLPFQKSVADPGSLWTNGIGGTYEALAQGFVADFDELDTVTLRVSCWPFSLPSSCIDGDTFTMTVELRDDLAGLPGTVLLSKDVVVSTPGGSVEIVPVDFGMPLERGAKYYVAVTKPAASAGFKLAGVEACIPQPPFVICPPDGGSTHNYQSGSWNTFTTSWVYDVHMVLDGDFWDGPADVRLDATDDGDIDWQQMGKFIATTRTSDFTSELNDYLAGCTPAGDGTCTVPLAISSSEAGTIRADNVDIGQGTIDPLMQSCGVSDVFPCAFGTQTCTDGTWDSCIGNIDPQPELCDTIDNDCDTVPDDGLADCQCIDGAPPAPVETCDTIDNDCDDATDEGCTCQDICTSLGYAFSACRTSGSLGAGCFAPDELDVGSSDDCISAGLDVDLSCCCSDAPPCIDADQDLFFGVNPSYDCSQGGLLALDCDDTDPFVFPGAPELCNDFDDDCDLSIDENVSRICGAGACAGGTQICGAGGIWGPCSSAPSGTDEVCDGIDNNCDGLADDYVETCTTGLPGVCGLGFRRCTAGSWEVCETFSAATEICDTFDNDCNGQTDEGFDADTDFLVDCLDNCPFDHNPDQKDTDTASPVGEGFEGGIFLGWEFSPSTNGQQSGANGVGTWSNSIITNALDGAFSARLLADATASVSPWNVQAAMNRPIGAAIGLDAKLKFDQISGTGGNGASHFQILVYSAAAPGQNISYGFSTTGDIAGNIRYTVSVGEELDFSADLATDYFNKYGTEIPDDLILRFGTFADFAESGSGRRTADIRIDLVVSTRLEGDGVGNLCDNCPNAQNATQDDLDGDGHGDVCDCAPALPGVFAVPSELSGLLFAVNTTNLSWASAAPGAGGATVHDLLRGEIADLPVGSGLSEVCVATVLAAMATDLQNPPLGKAYWYFVRGRNTCAPGTYGTPPGGVERVSATCP